MLKQFFMPESIALVGVSTNPEKLGYKILKNIIDGGYRGKIFPVNPKSGKILGLECYKSISEIKEKVELVVIVVPAKFVCDVAKECGEKGVKGLIVISAGFKEAGEEGRKREEELEKIIKKYNMRLIGPNCLGIIDTTNDLNASFAFDMPQKGKIAFITQSGALGTAVLDWAIKENIGLSKFVSFGNKADISEIDLIEELSDDPDTNVILLYLEGIEEGRKFIEVARDVSKKKPIIIVKSGITEMGSKAVSSHTGSIAGSDIAFEASFKKSGVIRAYSVEELFDYAIAFSYQPLIKGDRIAVVTNAGGPSVMAVDAIEKNGLKLAQISDTTKEKLKEFLPPSSNINNPVDCLGDVMAENYGKALNVVISDKNVEAVICILTPQVVTEPKETADKIIDVSKGFNKTVVGCFMGGKRIEPGIIRLSEGKIPNYPFPERAVSSLKGMVNYRKYLEKKEEKIITYKVNKEKVKEKLDNFKKAKIKVVGDIEGREILSLYGINTINSLIAKNLEDGKNIFKKMGYPVVMKLVSPDIIHKTEVGGVKVGIKTESEFEKAFNDIIRSVKEYKKDAKIEGIQIQQYIEGGIETIVGVNKDAQFGHLIMFGLGGIYVELFKDVSFSLVPLMENEVSDMIDDIKASKLFNGFRNIPPVDKEKIKETLLRVSQLVSDFPEIKEMDINPLIVKEKEVIAVDVRIGFDS
ncbi:MAG TPA: acetate--CoA ligase family protein [bacterium]|nr:acetate--CoA ligase family protein [bacterium]